MVRRSGHIDTCLLLLIDEEGVDYLFIVDSLNMCMHVLLDLSLSWIEKRKCGGERLLLRESKEHGEV